MKLSFSTNAFKRKSVFEAVRSIASIGYCGAEILCDVPHLYPPEWNETMYRKLSDYARECSLEIVNLNAFTFFAKGDTYNPSWIDPDPVVRRQRVDHTIGAIDAAARLGVACISTEPGGTYSVTDGDINPMLDLFEKGMKQVIPYACDRNVKLLIEPEPELLIEHSDSMLSFLDRLNSPQVGVNFDIGHFYCVGEDPVDALRLLYPYVGHVHLEDISQRVHQHLVPGQGDIDFRPVLSFLYDRGYSGYVTVELYPYQEKPEEAAMLSLEYMRRFDDLFERI
ncbi:MAG: sugar phosphate isomerase/epimerase family protein [Candidatus Auribacterota bacterium]|jgi:sugar phosphate isomerase/epimerase|nr:sugar phosphate isomerase/epimerase family protein [Candidatus Auribacterota bacterium]